jgi:hypothetical protein
LVDSHLDYDWDAWALDGADRRVRLTRLVRPFIELIALPSREVWMQDDGDAVAVWPAEPSEPVDPDVDDRPAGAPEAWAMWRPPAAAERTQSG